MRNFLITVLVLFATPVQAQEPRCQNITVRTAAGAAFIDQDISGGAVTTGEIPLSPYAEFTLNVDLTDASDTVTNLRFTIKLLSATGGTERNLWGDCSGFNPLVCKILKFDVDPRNAAEGKNGSIPIPTAYQLAKITVTPTGHGAGDAVSLTGVGCY